jgi:hypothetical protein
LPSKLLIVGAGDPMWRGPRSLFLHADRPLIAERHQHADARTLITRIRADGDDWIAEGPPSSINRTALPRRPARSCRQRAHEWMVEHGEMSNP